MKIRNGALGGWWNKQSHFLNIILNVTLSGFRPGFSCATVPSHYYRWHYWKMWGKFIIWLLLHFSKAFDTIDADILLSFLKAMGFEISTQLCCWSYISKDTAKMGIFQMVLKSAILDPTYFIYIIIFFTIRWY